MALSFADARALHPALKKRVWLNAAASSPGSLTAVAAMKAHLEETLDSGDLSYPAWARFKETLRARVARFIGASRAQDVGFTPSTSFGFHVMAQVLKARGLTEVAALESEFPSTTVPLLNAGLTVRGVRRRPDGSSEVEAYAEALRPTTRAIAVSVVQFDSGYRVDLEGISRLCKDRGLALLINAAQGLGNVAVDVEALGAAFLSGTSHKWLAAGHGQGILYAKAGWLDGALPLAGWLSVDPADLWRSVPSVEKVDDEHGFVAMGVRTRHEASALEVGGSSWVSLHGLNAALDIHEGLGATQILAHNLRLQALLRDGLRTRGFVPNAPDAPEVGSGICVVPVKGDPNEVVRVLLREAGIMTTARGGGVRISTHYFNTEDDVLALISAFDTLSIRPG